MLGFICFMVLWVLTGIYCELSVGKTLNKFLVWVEDTLQEYIWYLGQQKEM